MIYRVPVLLLPPYYPPRPYAVLAAGNVGSRKRERMPGNNLCVLRFIQPVTGLNNTYLQLLILLVQIGRVFRHQTDSVEREGSGNAADSRPVVPLVALTA